MLGAKGLLTPLIPDCSALRGIMSIKLITEIREKILRCGDIFSFRVKTLMNKHTVSVKQFIKNETVFCAAAALAALSCPGRKAGKRVSGIH